MKEACVVAVLEQGKRIVWDQVYTREVDPKSEENVVARTQEMEDALVTFTETNFVRHLHLGALDIVGLCNLYQESQSKESVPG